ncbi:polysaccharide deacetylase [Pelobium manganitolerans]|uniref:Polysaccharide deacetylase n=1 Tax=Pelobium manganitolerans TaxID=1842495 RepID=A0A419S2Q7_9SPHI|nr:polysaccharide deacetylase family protein [Pelobium manganitolerans]RKD13274.1 polysaccharide deacetylase [Pelobium manganitolerans]
MLFLTKTPYLLKKIYPKHLIWHKTRTEKVIYLTFDDGPIPIVTPWVLNTLKKFDVKATFFCIGDNIRKHPAIFEQLKAEGHAVGNHTFNHLNGWKTANETYLGNIAQCQQLTKTPLFRPPYGRIKFSQIRRLHEYQNSREQGARSKEQGIKSKDEGTMSKDGLQSSQISNLASQISIIMWDVLSGDFDPSLSPQKCLANTLKHTENGSIVVFHDSQKAWERLEYVLPRAIEHWKNEGYSFGLLQKSNPKP